MKARRSLQVLLAASGVLWLLLLRFQTAQGQWTQSPQTDGRFVTAFTMNGTTLFVSTSDSGVYRSTDNGDTWAAAKTGLPRDILTLASTGEAVFAGRDAGVYRSTTNGDTWTPVNFGLTNPSVYALFASGNTLFAGTAGSGVFRSTDNGANWGAANTSMTTATVQAFTGGSSNLFAGTRLGGVYRSTDNGVSWAQVNTTLTTLNVLALCIVGSDIYAGTAGGGVFRSTNNGTNWTNASTGFTTTTIYSLAASGANLFAGTFPSGVSNVLLSTSGGDWSSVGGALPQVSVNALAIAGAYIVAGTAARGIWRRPLSDVTALSDQIGSVYPQQFVLEQNFPNPFNPSTEIGFRLPAGQAGVPGLGSGWVRLAVYDLLGREVAVLVNEKKEPGNSTATWNASGVASGVYLYRIQSGEFIQTRKMVLMK